MDECMSHDRMCTLDLPLIGLQSKSFYLDWPTYDNMRITDDNNGQIRIPAVLNCSAAAYPPATYAWIDESNGNTINGPTITINHFGNYTCIASNIIRGRRYQQSKSITLQGT